MLALSKLIDRSDFDNPELARYLHLAANDEREAFALSSPPRLEPDTKHWQCAMTLRALDRHGLLKAGTLVAAVGAGTEKTSFALAAGGCVVMAVDRYLDATPRSVSTPPGMMVRPRSYTAIAYPTGHVIPLHGDPRALDLPSAFFDAACIAGSFEHLGSAEAMAAAAEELGRIVKPGGIVCICADFRLDGPAEREDFDSRWMLLTRQRINDLIVEPSGLRLIDDDFSSPSSETFACKRILSDLSSPSGNLQSLEASRDMSPNLVMFHEGFLFGSVHLSLQKSADASPRAAGRYSTALLKEVELNRRLTVDALGQLEMMRRQPGEGRLFAGSPTELEPELALLKASRSWRYTRPARKLARSIRKRPWAYRPVMAVSGLLRRLGRLLQSP